MAIAPTNLSKPWLSAGGWVAVVLCIAINLVVGVAVAIRNPEYFRDYRLNGNPDAVHYVTLGRNWWLDGDYSRQDKQPREPDMLRPPVYPIFAGGLEILGGPGLVYLTQSLLQVGSCVLLFLLVRPLLGNFAAACSALFLATDLMLAIFNFGAMSEPLFVFLTLAAALCIFPILLPTSAATRGQTWRLVGGSLLLASAILTRAAGLYLCPVVGLTALSIGYFQGCFTKTLRNVAVMAIITGIPLGLWIARNYAVFSVPRLTTTDAINNVYNVGAGAYMIKHGVSFEQAQQMIADEFDLPPVRFVCNPWACDRSVAEMDQELRRAAPAVLSKYPAELATSSLLCLAKSSLSHDTGLLAALLGKQWTPPTTEALLQNPGEAVRRLGQNGWLLVATFCWQVLHTTFTLFLAAIGVIVVLRSPSVRPGIWLLVATLAYFYLTVTLFGGEAYYRCRIPVLPFLYVFAGVGLMASCSFVKKALLRLGDSANRATAQVKV